MMHTCKYKAVRLGWLVRVTRWGRFFAWRINIQHFVFVKMVV